MTQIPPARFHAEQIDLHLTSDGRSAMLTLTNKIQGFVVTMSREALDHLSSRISNELERKHKKENSATPNVKA